MSDINSEEEGMEKQFRTIDISHLKCFAKGGTGECYRIDQDTILKLYYEGFPEERILNEKEGAKAALIAGVPTAISYWLVQAGAFASKANADAMLKRLKDLGISGMTW